MDVILSLLVLSWITHITLSECPNACSGRGKCGAFDMCTCYQNRVEADCSGRMCQFGLAHVDSPLGDLDSSGQLLPPTSTVVTNSQFYPFGTTELFPNMVDSDLNILSNSAHGYTECSSKGVCERSLGICLCYDGYTGTGCQYMACPSVNSIECYGHGVCENAKKIANSDNNNDYALWDQYTSRGCVCDAGWSGHDCSKKRCKVGYDPIYYDPDNSPRYSNWSIVIYAKTSSGGIIGNYSLIFYDASGEDWETIPISFGANCRTLISALESFPNDVIPAGSTRCVQWPSYHAISRSDDPAIGTTNPYIGTKYTLAFPLNPGILKAPHINMYLDGARATLFSNETTSTLGSFVFANGFHGETIDYFVKCAGVTVTISQASTAAYSYLGGLTSLENRLLSQCLGDSDGLAATVSATGKVEGNTYSWDYGTIYNPHLIKLVDRTAAPITDLCDRSFGSSVRAGSVTCNYARPPGFFAMLMYDAKAVQYKIFHNVGGDYSSSTQFSIFTTKGVVSMVSDQTRVYTDPNKLYSRTVYVTNSTTVNSGYLGNVDCETNSPNVNGARECLDKNSLVFFMDPAMSKTSFASNPKYLNMYTVSRIYRADKVVNAANEWGRYRIVLDKAITSVWSGTSLADTARAYLFTPHKFVDGETADYAGGYPYVAECSNRGLCDESAGDCVCASGFQGDACSIQNNVNV